MAAADHGEGSYSLGEEIELLEAIYIHELTVEGPRASPTAVSVLLHPSTGDEEHKRFVCLTLVIHLPQEYPSELPSIHIKTPRGLSETHIKSILSNLRELAETCLGRPMLYELIEYAKESLTDNNMPSCACAICLCHFQDSHEFTKTECYHYFHCGCLARYIEFSLQQEDETEDKTKVECPMCRLSITYNLTELQAVASIEVKEEEIVYKPSEDIRKLQKKMASLFDKQKKKGGVIDVEQERNRFLIDITSVRQEETFPESEPEDTVKKNPVTEPSSNNAPKRPDVAKENSEPNEPIRNDKPERPSVRNDKPERPSVHNDKPERPSVRYDKPEKPSVRNDKPERPSVRNDKPERPSVRKDKPERPSVRKDKPERPSIRYDKPERPSVHNDKPERPSVRNDKPERPSVRNDKQERPSVHNDKPERPSVRYDKPERPSVRYDKPEKPSVRYDKSERPSVRNDKPERPFRNADKTDWREKKDFPKISRTSRGPRTLFDRSGNRSGEEKVKQHEQRRTEKKRPVTDDRPRSTDQKDREKVVKKIEEEGKSCAPCADVKQVYAQTQLQPDKNPSVVHLSEKVAKDVSATSSNRSPTQNSNDERPRSARRGRGRSGRGRTSGGSKSEFQDGGKDLNKNTTSCGEGVQQTARTRPSGSVKTNLEKNACTQGQETDLKENPKDKKTCAINKDRAHRPPPGFENVVVDKGGCEQTTNDYRPPPPGF